MIMCVFPTLSRLQTVGSVLIPISISFFASHLLDTVLKRLDKPNNQAKMASTFVPTLVRQDEFTKLRKEVEDLRDIVYSQQSALNRIYMTIESIWHEIGYVKTILGPLCQRVHSLFILPKRADDSVQIV